MGEAEVQHRLRVLPQALHLQAGDGIAEPTELPEPGGGGWGGKGGRFTQPPKAGPEAALRRPAWPDRPTVGLPRRIGLQQRQAGQTLAATPPPAAPSPPSLAVWGGASAVVPRPPGCRGTWRATP